MTHNPDWAYVDYDPDTPAPEGSRPSRKGFPWSDLQHAYDSADAERPWFADGAIEGTPIAVLSGPEKRAKSWCAMQLSVAACVASAWLGQWPLRKCGSPMYIDGEYGQHEFARRIARISRGEEQRPEVILPVIRHYHSTYLILEPGNGPFRRLIEECKDDPPILLVIDPLRNHLPGDENEAHIVLAAMRCIAQLRDAACCPVLTLHHLNKSGYATGSRAISTRADLLIHGTDEADPEYTVKGRSVRAVDSITEPFHIDVTHEHDGDDRLAISRVRRRVRTLKATPVQDLADRLARLMESEGKPVTVNWLCGKVNRSHKDVADVLDVMRTAGRAHRKNITLSGRPAFAWVLGDPGGDPDETQISSGSPESGSI